MRSDKPWVAHSLLVREEGEYFGSRKITHCGGMSNNPDEGCALASQIVEEHNALLGIAEPAKSINALFELACNASVILDGAYHGLSDAGRSVVDEWRKESESIFGQFDKQRLAKGGGK
jgi:hypothetical protein